MNSYHKNLVTCPTRGHLFLFGDEPIQLTEQGRDVYQDGRRPERIL